MNLAALLVKLNLRLRDTDNFAFTSDEKTEALTEAMNDESVVSPVWDTSLTFTYSTYQYARPATIDVIKDIYIKRGNSSENKPEKISSDLWEVVGSNIQFKNEANAYIPTGYTLYLKGVNKYTSSDTISETNLQEYVLNLAQLHCLNMFGVVKAIKFVNNDSSMSEIVTMKRELERKVSQYKARLPRAFENA